MLGSSAAVLQLNGAAAVRAVSGPSDQRRHRRFVGVSVAARAATIDVRKPELRLRPCTLSNLSYGGMCFSTDAPVMQGGEYRFLINLSAPFDDVVLVKARITWTGVDEVGRPQAGAEFLESSKGWLGPDQD